MSTKITKRPNKHGKILGIDLGTSNSAAAVIVGGRAKIIPAAEGTTAGGKAFPSVVALSKNGDLLVGEPARRQAVANPYNTVITPKRKMGTTYKYKIHGKRYEPELISAFILQKIKRDAEALVGEPVEKAVITVPAYFDDNQRRATKDAGTIAGLDVIRIINEPTAAALAFGLDKSNEDMKILVFDLGGGTLDVTIMEIGGGVFEVMSTSGNTRLGGIDMDKALINYIVDEFKRKERINLSRDITAMTRIREAAEKAKIELSTVTETEISLPFIFHGRSGVKNLQMKITRAKLERLISSTVMLCEPSLLQALDDAGLRSDDIDKIVMVGGPTRMPLVRRFVGDMMGKEPESGVDPMEAVATGAAIQAGILNNDISTSIVLLDVTPLSLGTKMYDGRALIVIKKNTPIPASGTQRVTTVKDYQTAVEVSVTQGERPMADDNILLGKFTLVGIRPAPRDIPKIDVTFDIDASGILDASAMDLKTRKKAELQIVSTKLNSEEIEKMKTAAAKFSMEDKIKKEKAELFVKVDQYIYEAKSMISNSNISQRKRTKIAIAISDVETVIDMDAKVLEPKYRALRSMVDKIR